MTERLKGEQLPLISETYRTRFELFLRTFTPREETIIRYKFGVGVKAETDKQIVDRISEYSKYFNMAQLRRHYNALTLMTQDKERRQFGIIFDFASARLIFIDVELQLEYEIEKTLDEVF